MSEEIDNIAIPASEVVEEKGFFQAGINAVEKVAKVTKSHGVRNTSVATGVVILIALVVEFLTTGDYVPHHGEVIGLVSGVLLILGPLIVNSVEYKWELNARIHEIEFTTEQLRIEAEFEIARLGKTQLGKIEEKPGSITPTPRP